MQFQHTSTFIALSQYDVLIMKQTCPKRSCFWDNQMLCILVQVWGKNFLLIRVKLSVCSKYCYSFFVLWIIPDGLLLLVKAVEQFIGMWHNTRTYVYTHAQGGFCPKSLYNQPKKPSFSKQTIRNCLINCYIDVYIAV